MNKYTKEQKEFLINNNYMKTAKELAEMFNKKFKMNLTPQNIKTFRGNHKLNSGLTGRYIQMVHADYERAVEVGFTYNKWFKTTEHVGVGKHVCKVFKKLYPNEEITTIYNLLDEIEETKPILKLISATRISPEKGYEELGYGYRKLFIDTMRTSLYIDIWKSTRDIRLRVDTDEKVIDLRNELDYLYDLIKADLIEKVEE